jgi:hypothetical protein
LAVALVWTGSAALERMTGFAGFGVLGSVVGFALLGFAGAERVWFVAADRGERIAWHDVGRFTRLLWWPYLRLGLYVGLITVIPFVWILVATDQGSLVQTLLLFALFAVIDLALTFATVVMAFFDMSAGDAVRTSLAIVREQWPSCSFYVLVAPLALQLVVALLPRDSIGSATRLLAIAAVAVVKLACQGATALFYADRYLALDQQPNASS